MKPVRRDELVDYQTYSERRDALRPAIIAQKQRRRVHLGGCLTFLFENRESVRYQVQEMMRAERIVKEAEIQHELDAYNELLGGPGELGCTLLIEIDDPAERDRKLSRWQRLPEHLFARLPDDSIVRARFDERQVDERRLSAVQYLRFPTEGQVPEALICTLPELQAEVTLSDDQRAALAEDLQG